MKYQLKAYNIHELGQRQNQEDSLFPAYGKATQEDRLFILCDGMGGHEKGEVASATVCETISQAILTHWNTNEPLNDDSLRQAIDGAYDALDAKDDNAERKMGTTLTLLCLHANGATIAHIGDSRVYQFRPGKGVVFRTQDHSLVNDLIKIGEITEEEAKTHPQKNVITRAMQPHQPSRAKADIAHITDIKAGDYFFLCSDGMLEQSTDENLANVITKKVPDEQKVEMLRSMTEENKDNHTAHLIHIEKVSGAIVESTPRPKGKEPVGTWVDVDMPKPKSQLKKKISIYIIGAVAIALLVFAGVLTYKMIFSPKDHAPKQKIENKLIHKQQRKHKDSVIKYNPNIKPIENNESSVKQSKDSKEEKCNIQPKPKQTFENGTLKKAIDLSKKTKVHEMGWGKAIFYGVCKSKIIPKNISLETETKEKVLLCFVYILYIVVAIAAGAAIYFLFLSADYSSFFFSLAFAIAFFFMAKCTHKEYKETYEPKHYEYGTSSTHIQLSDDQNREIRQLLDSRNKHK